jgi:hypothetical protein
MLFAICLREYLVTVIRDNPVIQLHLNLLFDVDKFCTRVVDAANQLRLLVYEYMTKSTKEKQSSLLLANIKYASEQAHRHILMLAYKRKRRPLLSDFHNLVSHVTIKPLPLEPCHEDYMLQLLNRLDPATSQPFEELLEFMEGLQLPRGAIRRVKLLYKAYNELMCNRKLLRQQLHELATFFPYSYSLVCAYAQIWRSLNWIQAYSLPHHYRENAMRAIQERFQTKEAEVVASDVADLWLCRGCRSIYSIVVAYPSEPCKEHQLDWCPRHHRDYEYGYQGMIVDTSWDRDPELEPPRAYCANEHDIFDVHKPYRPSEVVRNQNPDSGVLRAHIQREELVRISLMGRMVVMERCIYMLCPQEGCGVLMVLNTDKCVYNERGYACAACSYLIRKKRADEYFDSPDQEEEEDKGEKKRRKTKETATTVQCTWCEKKIKPRQAYLYPYGVTLCPRHHQPEAIERKITQQSPTSHQQFLSILKSVYEEHKKEMQQRQAPWQRKQLQISRASHSNKHR